MRNTWTGLFRSLGALRTCASNSLWFFIAAMVGVAIWPFLWTISLHAIALIQQGTAGTQADIVDKLAVLPPEDLIANIRNLGLIVLGIIGTVLAVWRSRLAHQAHKLSEKGLIIDRYQKGASMLESEELAVRLAGVYALRELALSEPKETYFLVLDILCDFARERSKQPRPERIFPTDIQKTIDAISTIRKSVRDALKWEFDKLWRVNFTYADFSDASLRGAFLSCANFHGARLCAVNFTGTKLQGANLSNTVLNAAIFKATNVSGTRFSNSTVEQAIIEGFISWDKALIPENSAIQQRTHVMVIPWDETEYDLFIRHRFFTQFHFH